ncbi:phospho-2-dehydro-3-deoxyheptonate aldolase [Helicobacter enhydrae]|uniref:Phospho-2-dehydro-3-deoxyheptonate aldolase n=2 Tax=Helicobacter enhydrae TaxID=222136 RepID=A0A1B1U3R8_9HELI|nr:3-deoxy-7-phosphoheptulonate synthase class II [Helicobacter enhydrae]ANV97335.1 phospho-2-dehydro-3-deoxyheptonate aldolase [Helicobacter enhydrae]
MRQSNKWEPQSWRKFPIKQAPQYRNLEELERVEGELRGYPPLVFAKEVDLLKAKLSRVNEENLFILQGGDCAESFTRFGGQRIRDFYKLMLQMSVILGFCSGMEILKIGRIAGQFAKPRSEEFEEIDGKMLPSFRGDIINGSEPTAESRVHQPQRMLQAYHQSASTLNLLRAFCNGGMADLHLIQQYNLDFVRSHPMGEKYQTLTQEISQSLAFIESCGIEAKQAPKLSEFFISHEALLLPYEECLCRTDSLSGRIYDCSAHFLWIGERTFDSQAHLEFMRGISNPKGIKVSPRMTSTDLLRLLDWFNPDNQKGEIVLIVRMGETIKHSLPPLLEVLEKEKREVVLLNDPMHGNTIKQGGIKTRYFASILQELDRFFEICADCGMKAGGIHLEMTAEEVTECIGGMIDVGSLSKNYQTTCDPRLNASQSLELAFGLGEKMRKRFG